MTLEEMLEEARRVHDGKTRSYVKAAMLFAEFLLAHQEELKKMSDAGKHAGEP